MTTKWGVYVEIDTNEWMWDTGKNTINDGSPPILFDTKEEARNFVSKIDWNVSVRNVNIQPVP